jgi:uncharacterized C2H2 Zn-finger protein
MFKVEVYTDTGIYLDNCPVCDMRWAYGEWFETKNFWFLTCCRCMHLFRIEKKTTRWWSKKHRAHLVWRRVHKKTGMNIHV